MSGLDRMFAKVVLASRPECGTALPLITMHLHYPDIIHGEVMTHRVYSRNARSMRAVPVKTMAQEVMDDPFMPWHWGKNQRGMQASEECNEKIEFQQFDEPSPLDWMTREEAWRHEAAHAAQKALAYDAAGYHKQVANRILAPYTWKHTLISGTSWANFLHLRDHEDAEPHFHDLAGMVREALRTAEYQFLGQDAWHLPYITQEDREEARRRAGSAEGSNDRYWALLLKLSVARSARISYTPFDGDPSIERELERYDLLVGSQPLHASPTEHQAKLDTQSTYRRQVKVFSSPISSEYDLWRTESEGNEWNHPDLSGNFDPGWIQYRKTLTGEFIKDAA